MTSPPDSSTAENVDPAIDRLWGEPLKSRTRFLMRRLLVVFTLLVIFTGLLLALLALNPGFLMGIAVTIVLIPVAIGLSMAGEMLFAIPKLLSYKSYRKEWEQANVDAGQLDFPDYARRRSSSS